MCWIFGYGFGLVDCFYYVEINIVILFYGKDDFIFNFYVCEIIVFGEKC